LPALDVTSGDVVALLIVVSAFAAAARRAARVVMQVALSAWRIGEFSLLLSGMEIWPGYVNWSGGLAGSGA